MTNDWRYSHPGSSDIFTGRLGRAGDGAEERIASPRGDGFRFAQPILRTWTLYLPQL